MTRMQLAGLLLPLAMLASTELASPALASPALAHPPPPSRAAQPASALLPPYDKLLRDIYQELVEINTTNSSGDCTEAAKAMAARLKAGGYTDEEMRIIVPPGGAKKGNLVARLKGDGTKKPLMLLAHIDVVEAKREDWVRDQFKLIEEGGYSKNYCLPGAGRGPILVKDCDTHIGHWPAPGGPL